MRAYATGCIHSYLPVVPDDADLLLIAGDLYGGPNSLSYWANHFRGKFLGWVDDLCNRGVKVVATLGNHDPTPPWVGPLFDDYHKNFHLLLDRSITIDGLTIYGTPWTPTFGNWQWMKSEAELEKIFSHIPEGLDILLSHGPPFGVVDEVPQQIFEGGIIRDRAGSKALRQAVLDKKPKVGLFSHLHSNGGKREMLGDTICYGVSHVDENYFPVLPPVLIEEFF